MVTVSPEEATDWALVILLNGEAWVPGLLSLPVGEMNQVVAKAETGSKASSGRTRSTRPNGSEAVFIVVGAGLKCVRGSGRQPGFARSSSDLRRASTAQIS